MSSSVRSNPHVKKGSSTAYRLGGTDYYVKMGTNRLGYSDEDVQVRTYRLGRRAEDVQYSNCFIYVYRSVYFRLRRILKVSKHMRIFLYRLRSKR